MSPWSIRDWLPLLALGYPSRAYRVIERTWDRACTPEMELKFHMAAKRAEQEAIDKAAAKRARKAARKEQL